MKAFAGTWRLFRLDLRLDRLRLPAWIFANIAIIAATLPQLADAYNTEPKRLIYTTTSASSAVTRLLNGAITGPSMGNIAVVETFFLAVILMALMNIFLVTRHTRLEEETNRSEVIGSAEVGRQASLTATFVLAALTNLVTAALIFAVFRANNLPLEGSLAYSLALGGLGMVFAGVAGVTSQLFESTRTANSLAGLVFGVAFVIRGIGDVVGQLQPGGLGVIPNAISWFSPVGWVLNIQAFTGERWWTMALFAGLTVALIVVSYALLDRRDVGASLFPPRLGRAHARPFLLTRFGLLWRLNRTSTLAWGASIVASGATIGAVAHEFAQLIESNEEMERLLAEMGGGRDVTEILFGVMFIIIGIATAGYALQIVTRMRQEEASQRLEVLLSAPLSRWRWMLTYVIYAAVTSVIILILTGFTTGLVYGLISGDLLHNVRSLTGSILVYIPAIGVMIGASLVFFGTLPRWFTTLAWLSLGASLLLFQLGAILNLPQWMLDLSPFTHVPPVPSTDLTFKPLVYLSIIAIALIVAGLFTFRRRDILTS